MKLLVQAAFVLGIALYGHATQAATLYLSPSTALLHRGDSIKLSLRLDVDRDECVNAIDGVISYSENIEPTDISRGASIMSMWVEEPIIDREARTITFAGGIPNGYCGRIVGDPRLTNNIVDLIFQSPGFVVGNKQGTSSDIARVEVSEDTQVYLNDGFGTRTNVNRYGAEIALDAKAGTEIQNPWNDAVVNDQQAPEEFSISLERTENAFSNRYFITFNTTDKQSGLDHYEVIEEPLTDFWSFRWGGTDAPWIETRSPYVLKDQSLNSTVRVRAIDKAGNEYIANLVPDESQRRLTTESLVVLSALSVLVCLVALGGCLWYFLRRRSRARSAEVVSNSSPEQIPETE